MKSSKFSIQNVPFGGYNLRDYIHLIGLRPITCLYRCVKRLHLDIFLGK